jgi:hypothetical protein
MAPDEREASWRRSEEQWWTSGLWHKLTSPYPGWDRIDRGNLERGPSTLGGVLLMVLLLIGGGHITVLLGWSEYWSSKALGICWLAALMLVLDVLFHYQWRRRTPPL